MSTATIAPTWMTAVNAVTASESMSLPSSFSAIVRCAVDETGRNSVRPSTIPRMIASRMLTGRSAWSAAPYPDRRREDGCADGVSHLPFIGHQPDDVTGHGGPLPVSSASDDPRPFFAVTDEEIDATTHVVAIAGEVDLYSAPELKAHVLDAIDAGKTRIIVDLTNTTFIDSTTLGVLVGARKRLREQEGTLAVVCPDPDKVGLFEMTGLDRVFAIHSDRAAALAALPSSS